MPSPEKSRGHIGWFGDYELLQFGTNIYRAHKTDVIDIDTGIRVGARFEGPESQLSFLRKKFGV